ncbi:MULTISPECIES: UDP-N-acetylmuramoyl-tripeptide--D-alanyl-D-alanine ligase [unclassified Cryobacterium]|uniref:UDP-N-acetylmuramoyl-tripeptide--D-alanyl-D- alanine ligase n=1 Tax=unclassified Cryobacterium TaxID=2649013 RepID=UPI002AB368C3|nr:MULTISPECIES: UDP-N-acetylmuramoyl-tripeptide--D-alanyl-D-alanine ligase [unclassified Cryobacterium]MDY7543634.1 UDP-N-acetylmuramoyl-tripeptide--D-alanyl-D-alanine ligase [Cryobacterium sp. 5B3]MEA9998679.1 UDP-N-acetylmuramoyl-tripeptide--D-alanyl-D-alanine ligase [Cryobacterium sp. RTS3]MEB0264406.1 UDP-N-acetylmuramoyl-tripeptide--D-alanyl-D-alanine ligase [Cryobacterium sp. 10I5]MEB0273010.1 UDP-N-acetylmuramoyl-tripeptide--D-alanyl-D-alanine ligase [Cryobacterium sp. 5B3]
MIALSLSEIADAVNGVLHLDGAVNADGTSATPATVVSGAVDTDSREIRAGGIFVAKPGEATDGHLFAPAAIENGAALLIVERALDLPVAQIIVGDAVVALGDLATVVVDRVRAEGRLRVIGVTGSNGKTTTKNLLRAILGRVGPTVAARASFNNEVGAPITMLAVDFDTRFLVAEMGASGIGEIARLIRMVRPDVGVVLKVGLAHAGEFGGIEATLAAKTEMVTDLLETDVAVLNADDPRVAGMRAHTRARVVWFGQDATGASRAPDGTDFSGVHATGIEVSSSGTTFTLHLAGGDTRPVTFQVLGEHHVMNALAAAATAEVLGVGIDDIVAALESVVTAERWRMQVLGGRDGVTIINDAYNASPDSMTAALKTLAQIREPGQRTVAVLGEMSELGEFSGDEHDRIGLLAVRLNISQLIVVGRAARRMHISTINEGSWDGESLFVENQDDAFALLTATVRPGDTVLVKSSNSAGLRFLGDRLGEYFS